MVMNDTSHPCHTEQLGKLNRAIGQMEAVKKMIDEGRYCVDIMTQVKAARSALKSVELAILEKHMHSCLSDAVKNGKDAENEKIGEIIALLKKYE